MKPFDFRKAVSEALRDQTMTMMGEDDEVEMEGHDVSEDTVTDDLGADVGNHPDDIAELGEALAHTVLDILQDNQKKVVNIYQKRAGVTNGMVNASPTAHIVPDEVVDNALRHNDLREALVELVGYASRKGKK